mgnify:CR=1 FL=1
MAQTFKGFINDNAIKLSAALSYYTIFSLAPLLIIIISLSGIFFGDEAVSGRIFGQISGLVGSEAALQIQEIILLQLLIKYHQEHASNGKYPLSLSA